MLCAWFVMEQISNWDQDCKEKGLLLGSVCLEAWEELCRSRFERKNCETTSCQCHGSSNCNSIANGKLTEEPILYILLNLELAQHQVGTIPCSHPHAYFPDQVAWLPCVWSQLSVYGIIRIGFMGSLRPFYTWGMCLMEVMLPRPESLITIKSGNNTTEVRKGVDGNKPTFI